MTPMAELILPQETWDQIIDFFHSDFASLGTCSLVCKAWLPSCRYHQFSIVSIGTRSCTQFFELLYGRPDNNVESFVRTLEIQCADIVSVTESRVLWQTIPLIRPHLSRGIKLSLVSGRFNQLPIIEIHDHFRDIRSLSLETSSFPTFAGLVAFISGFPFLEELSVSRMSWNIQNEGNLLHLRKFTRKKPLRMNLLDLTRGRIRLFVEWLLVQDQLPIIQTLCLDLSHDEPAAMIPVWRFLEVAGPSISRLEVNLPSHSRIICTEGK